MTNGRIIGFIIWLAIAVLFIGIGLWCFKAKEATGFWANAKTPPMDHVKSYNKAMGKLWCVYGIVFLILGIPLLIGNKIWILVSIIGVMIETITIMVVYSIKIEPKYRKK